MRENRNKEQEEVLDPNDSVPCALSILGSNSENIQQVTVLDISSATRVRTNVRGKKIIHYKVPLIFFSPCPLTAEALTPSYFINTVKTIFSSLEHKLKIFKTKFS